MLSETAKEIEKAISQIDDGIIPSIETNWREIKSMANKAEQQLEEIQDLIRMRIG